MDPNYYANTLVTAVMKLGPIVLYTIGLYFLCIKLPFWIMSKMVKGNQSGFPDVSSNYKHEDYDAFIHRLNAQNDWIEAAKTEKKTQTTNEKKEEKRESPKQEAKREQKAEAKKEQKQKPKTEHKQEQKQGPKQEQKKERPQPTEEVKSLRLSPEEEIFSLTPGQVLTKGDLKKRYHDLIRTHHPDKVASLAPEFKKMAEKKTKEINQAYDRLKKKAA